MTLLEQLEAYRLRNGLTRKSLAHVLGVHEDTIGHWFSQGNSANAPSRDSLVKIEQLLGRKGGEETGAIRALEASLLIEAQRRSQKVKYLLLLLEDELGWFREAEPEAREALRKAVPFDDVGYISSLLGMLGDEEMFRRWQTFTTYKFGGFKGR